MSPLQRAQKPAEPRALVCTPETATGRSAAKHAGSTGRSRSIRVVSRGACVGCSASWTDPRCCHCSLCHVTWAGLELFDQHRWRRDGVIVCYRPQEMTCRGRRLVNRGGMWGVPGRPLSADH